MRTRTLRCLSPEGFHRLHYREWGDPGNDRVVVCVHGLTRNGADFDALARALAARFRVLCPDVVGRGRSDWLRDKRLYGYPQYLADLSALIARSGADEVQWVGTSMGGLIGMMLAAQRETPLTRLVLNDVGPFLPRMALERIVGYVGDDPRFADRAALDGFLREIYAPFGPFTEAQWAALVDSSIRETAEGDLGLAYDPGIAVPLRAGPVTDVDLWSTWDAIELPVFLVHGERSDVLPASVVDEMTRRGPQLENTLTLPDIGHAPGLMSTREIERIEHWLEA